MPIPAWRAKQSTNTSGTGTLVLNAAATAFRSFMAAFGASSVKVLYCLSGSSYFEIGIGTFNGGSPGSLTRDTVLASSNAGALVSLPASTSDVFATFLPNQAETVSFSATTGVQLADLGCIFHFTGSSAATLTLPAIATVPPNTGIVVRNAATVAAGILTIDPNASEQVNGSTTLALYPGEAVMLYAVGGAWWTNGIGASARAVSSFSATTSVALADLGCLFHFTGSSAATLNLPAVASVPPSAGITVRNSAAITSAGVLTIDPNASEQINGQATLLLFPGESVQLYMVGGAWFAAGINTGMRAVRQQAAAGVAQVDFTLPADCVDFQLRVRDFLPATDGAIAVLRTSSDGGSTFAAAASDYTNSYILSDTPSAGTSNGSSIQLSASMDNVGGGASGFLLTDFSIGSGTRPPQFLTRQYSIENVGNGWRTSVFGGHRSALAAINAIRVLTTSGNISTATMTLYGARQ